MYTQVTGALLHTAHFLFHVLPVFAVAIWYGQYYITRGLGLHTLVALGIFIVYATIVNVYGVYRSTLAEMMIIGSAMSLVYCFVIFYLNIMAVGNRLAILPENP